MKVTPWSCTRGSCASWWGCCLGCTIKINPRYLLTSICICFVHMTDFLSSFQPETPFPFALGTMHQQNYHLLQEVSVCLRPLIELLPPTFPRLFKTDHFCWWNDLKCTAKQKPTKMIESSWGQSWVLNIALGLGGTRNPLLPFIHPSHGCWLWSWLGALCRTHMADEMDTGQRVLHYGWWGGTRTWWQCRLNK